MDKHGRLRPQVSGSSVRIRGWLPHADEPFYDANHLLTLSHVYSVHISGTPHVKNIDALTEVGPLKRLFLEVRELDQTDILERIDPSELVSLHLEETAPKEIDLEVLQRFKKLEYLCVRHEKNLRAISGLKWLKRLTIRLTTKVPCDFLSDLENLEELQLNLGAQRDFSSAVLPRLRRLEIVQVRYLEELGDLTRLQIFRHPEVHKECCRRLGRGIPIGFLGHGFGSPCFGWHRRGSSNSDWDLIDVRGTDVRSDFRQHLGTLTGSCCMDQIMWYSLPVSGCP